MESCQDKKLSGKLPNRWWKKINEKIKIVENLIPYLLKDTIDSKRYKKANKEIELIGNDDNLIIYYYSCDSINSNDTAKITGIGYKLNGDDELFIKTIESCSEKDLIEWFFNEFTNKQKFLSFYLLKDYSFNHIVARAKINKIDRIIEPKNEYSLNKLFINKYKVFYAKAKEYGKGFLWLAKKNNLKTDEFLSGEDEFTLTDYKKLESSIKRKIILINELLQKDVAGKLKHKSKWYEYYGFSLNSLYMVMTNTFWGKVFINIMTFIFGILITICLRHYFPTI